MNGLIYFPNELLNKIFEYLSYQDIKKCMSINSMIFNKLRNILDLMKNLDFTINFISKTLLNYESENIKLSRQLINNLNYEKNNDWFNLLKLRYFPLFKLYNKECRHSSRVFPNNELFSKLLRHPERFLVNEPEIIYHCDYEKKIGPEQLKPNCYIDFSYHNVGFAEMLNHKSIVFSGRVSINIRERSIMIHGNIRLVYDNELILFLNTYSSNFFIYKKPLKRNLRVDVNNQTIKLEIIVPNSFEEKEIVINFCCYIMAELLNVKYNDLKSNKITVGDKLLNIIGDFSGSYKKTNFLFGNLKEMYISTGSELCL